MREGASLVGRQRFREVDHPLFVVRMHRRCNRPTFLAAQYHITGGLDRCHLTILPNAMLAIQPHHGFNVGRWISANPGFDEATRGEFAKRLNAQLGLLRS
jgi:hypothetical protein